MPLYFIVSLSMWSLRIFVANNWHFKTCIFIIPITASAVMVAINWNFAIDATSNDKHIWLVVVFIAALLPCVCVGMSFIFSALTLLPFHALMVRLNGGPFRVGDKVILLAGKHRGLLTYVYSLWQGDSIRVELGSSAKEDYSDVVGQHQLLRAK